MCRMCALTNTDSDGMLRPLILDRMMLLGNADQTPQKDGWGVTDGQHLFKASGPYRQYAHANWMDALETQKIWLGHVRQASSNTSSTDAEAHPYQFKHFTAMHNGGFGGTWKPCNNSVPQGSPNTDSWRAFFVLNTMLEDGKVLPEIIDQWLSLYEDDSQFVLFIMHNHQLHIVRGPKTRYMSFGEHGNGLIFHTDDAVLKSMNDWLGFYTGESITNITEFPELHYARLNPGSTTFEEMRKLDWKPQASRQTTYISNSYSSTAATKQTNGKWIRATSTVKAPEEVSIKLQQWGKVWQSMYPLREYLAIEYTSWIIRKTVMNFKTPETYQDFYVFDLETAAEYLKENLMTEKQRKIINIWNQYVSEKDEETLYPFIVPEDGTPFWLLENGLEIVSELKGAEQ